MSTLPERITRCWQGGYHANSAGPCFDEIGQAVAHRDREDREWSERIDRDVRRYPHLKRQYDAEGWPDGREVIGENGEPKLIYAINQNGIEVHSSTRSGASRMWRRMIDRRAEAGRS